jgi:SAM-dependent methyltransferase
MARQGAPRERTLAAVRAFWDGEASELGGTPQVTIRDLYFRVHELHTLLALIPRRPRLLDAGCGTGLGTLVLSRRAGHALGVDASSGMLAWARRLQADGAFRAEMSDAFSSLWDFPRDGSGRLDYVQADILDLDLAPPAFDVITAQRLLINLPSEPDQLKALRSLRRHAAADGVLVVGETTEQGYARTDEYRARFGLSRLERHWHNLYLDEDQLRRWPEAGWRVQSVLGFDTYMLLSKVVYPAACGEDRCRFLSAANAAAMELACVFRSRSAVEEVGEAALLGMYVERVAGYDAELGHQVGEWVARHASNLPDWRDLGHQRLIVARAC